MGPKYRTYHESHRLPSQISTKHVDKAQGCSKQCPHRACDGRADGNLNCLIMDEAHSYEASIQTPPAIMPFSICCHFTRILESAEPICQLNSFVRAS